MIELLLTWWCSMAVHPISPLGRMKVAVTVDDMMLLPQWPHAPGHDAFTTARAFVSALAIHGIAGVYQFSNTWPLENDDALYGALDIWAEAGHHFGNHTHHHPSLNWMEPADYVREIELAERHLEGYLSAAPCRCFRFCADQWGDSRLKCEYVANELARLNYTPVPVSAAFHDAAWSSAYRRTILKGDQEAANRVRNAYAESALSELRLTAANARAVFGRDPVHIWLIHGTSIAADALDQILDRFEEAGVEFVGLGEAMSDQMNYEQPPRISSEFIFQVEKWAMARGVPVEFPVPEALEEIELLHPLEGEMSADLIRSLQGSILRAIDTSTPAGHDRYSAS